MAKVALFSWFSPQKAAEVGAVWTEQQKTIRPDRLMKTLFGPVDWMDTEGSHSLSVFEVANDKLWDGLVELVANMRPYATIEGYRYETQFVFAPEDSQEIIKIFAKMDAKAKK